MTINMMSLQGKRALVMGVANHRSLAWGVAAAFHRAGAQLTFTYRRDRSRKHLRDLLDGVGDGGRSLTIACDVRSDADIETVFTKITDHWGNLDVIVHSIAHAERSDLMGPFRAITRMGFSQALGTSAYSLIPIARHAIPLLEAAGGGSIIALTYDAVERVVSGYGVMAPAKAALEAEVRYLAAELGVHRIRVNAISAGAIRTRASSAVRGVSRLRQVTETISPLRKNITQDDVGVVALFLASDFSRAVTGTTIFVDAGMHVVGVSESRTEIPSSGTKADVPS